VDLPVMQVAAMEAAPVANGGVSGTELPMVQ
jgi:hypothetical protein